MGRLTLRSIFDRLDKNQDGRITKDDAKDFVKKAGVGGGLLGFVVEEQAAAILLEQLGGEGATFETVSKEVTRRIAALKANGAAGDAGYALVSYFEENDRGGDDALSLDELRPGVHAGIVAERGRMEADLAATAATKVLMRMLDESGDGKLQRSEVDELAEELGLKK
jgi:Ca2+-binding EF-hand superfamily protein